MENVIRDKSKHHRILFVALLIFVLTLPLSKSISSVAIGLIYAYCLTFFSFDRDFRGTVIRNIRQPLNVSLILFLLIMFLRSLFSENVANGMTFVKQVSNLLIIYVAVSLVIDSEQDEAQRRKGTESLLLYFIAGIFLLDILGLLTYAGVIGNNKHSLPLTPLKMHHVWAGNLNAVGLYATVSLLLFSRYRKTLAESIFLWCFIGVGSVSILLSLSRAAWFGTILTSLVLFFFLIKDKKIFVITGISLIAVCLTVYSFSDIVHQRIDLIFRDISLFSVGVTNTSIGARFLMWKAAFTLFLSHPVFGVGTGDYQTALAGLVSAGVLPSFVRKFNQPHNMYLFTLATSGLIGFSALLFIFYRIFHFAGSLIGYHHNERLFGFLSMAVAVHYVTAGMAESLLNIHVLICSFALVSGICLRRGLFPSSYLA